VEVEDPNPLLTRKPAIKLAKLSRSKNPAQQVEEKTAFPRHWPSPSSEILPDCLHLEGLPMMDPQFIPLQEWWHQCFDNVMAPVPKVLPPFREVNHWITLIDLNKRYLEWRVTCPQALKGQL